MSARQIKCKKTGKMKYIIRCMRSNCPYLLAGIHNTYWFDLLKPKLVKTDLHAVKYKCQFKRS